MYDFLINISLQVFLENVKSSVFKLPVEYDRIDMLALQEITEFRLSFEKE